MKLILLEVAPKLAEACAEVERMEKPLLEYCQAEDFDLEEYLRRRATMGATIRK